MKDFFGIYDALIDGIDSDARVDSAVVGTRWTAVTAGGHTGIAMTVGVESCPRMFPKGIVDLTLREAAKAVKSWNLAEASLGMAAINAFYNTPERVRSLRAAEPYENYCTRGLELRGKRVAMIGHMVYPESALAGIERLYILEREPQKGDYPDSACECLLPQCDLVLITGSALVNKTMPRLLELSKNALTILTGPTVPLCPALLGQPVCRLAGMAVTDASIGPAIGGSLVSSPYPYGECFLLGK